MSLKLDQQVPADEYESNTNQISRSQQESCLYSDHCGCISTEKHSGNTKCCHVESTKQCQAPQTTGIEVPTIVNSRTTSDKFCRAQEADQGDSKKNGTDFNSEGNDRIHSVSSCLTISEKSEKEAMLRVQRANESPTLEDREEVNIRIEDCVETVQGETGVDKVNWLKVMADLVCQQNSTISIEKHQDEGDCYETIEDDQDSQKDSTDKVDCTSQEDVEKDDHFMQDKNQGQNQYNQQHGTLEEDQQDDTLSKLDKSHEDETLELKCNDGPHLKSCLKKMEDDNSVVPSTRSVFEDSPHIRFGSPLAETMEYEVSSCSLDDTQELFSQELANFIDHSMYADDVYDTDDEMSGQREQRIDISCNAENQISAIGTDMPTHILVAEMDEFGDEQPLTGVTYTFPRNPNVATDETDYVGEEYNFCEDTEHEKLLNQGKEDECGVGVESVMDVLLTNVVKSVSGHDYSDIGHCRETYKEKEKCRDDAAVPENPEEKVKVEKIPQVVSPTNTEKNFAMEELFFRLAGLEYSRSITGNALVSSPTVSSNPPQVSHKPENLITSDEVRESLPSESADEVAIQNEISEAVSEVIHHLFQELNKTSNLEEKENPSHHPSGRKVNSGEGDAKTQEDEDKSMKAVCGVELPKLIPDNTQMEFKIERGEDVNQETKTQVTRKRKADEDNPEEGTHISTETPKVVREDCMIDHEKDEQISTKKYKHGTMQSLKPQIDTNVIASRETAFHDQIGQTEFDVQSKPETGHAVGMNELHLDQEVPAGKTDADDEFPEGQFYEDSHPVEKVIETTENELEATTPLQDSQDSTDGSQEEPEDGHGALKQYSASAFPWRTGQCSLWQNSILPHSQQRKSYYTDPDPSDAIQRVRPLQNSGAQRRVGLSRKQRVKSLHPYIHKTS